MTTPHTPNAPSCLARWRWAVMTLLAAAGLTVAGGEREDPLPIRRLLLPAERVPAAMERLEQGALVRLSRAEFEKRVRAAMRGRKARGAGPRLVEARYRATLVEEALVGSGQWKVVHDGPGAGLLRLHQLPQPFNLALARPRFEDRDALVAEFDGRHLALLIDRPGEHAISFDWSARSEARPEGLHFDLEVPPCAVASLELNLPADRVVAPPDGALVSGPHPAEAGDRRLWKVMCSGRPQVDLLVRSAPGTPGGKPPLLLARQRTTQKLSPDGLEATFEFALEVLHQGVRELVFECDPVLRPSDVVVAGLDTYVLRPGATPAAPSLLTVRLREPLQQGIVQVHCVAPLAGASAPAGPGGGPRAVDWTSPGVRLRGAVPRGETLELILAPELRVEGWHPGGFRLVETSAGRGPARGAGAQSLTLVGGGIEPDGAAAGTPSRRPRARLGALGVEFRAVQKAWWRLGPAGMALTLQVHYEVSRGHLFQLPLLLPAGWEVEQVDLSPADWLRASGVRRVNGRDLLRVDLRQPLGRAGTAGGAKAGAPAGGAAPRAGAVPLVLTVRLRPAPAAAVAGREWPFPDAEPLGARFREGSLAIDFDEQVYESVVKTAAPRAAGPDEGPWGKRVPEYIYRYRGSAVQGSIRLGVRPPRVRARCHTSVFVAAGRAVVETRLELRAEVGSPEAVDVGLSATGGGPWEWRAAPGRGATANNRVKRAERLRGAEAAAVAGVLAAAGPLQAAALHAARPRGERWRLTLERPLQAGEPLVLLAARHLEPAGGRWEVPLPSVIGAARMEGEVTLHLAGADLVRLETAGLREAPGATAWRTFRYASGPIRLTLRGQVLAADRSAEAVAGPAALTSYLGGDGTAEHHFTFTMANWPQRTLPLRLPAGARPLAAQVDGRWLPSLASHETEGRPTLELPVPGREDGGTRHTFEVVYLGPAAGVREGRAEPPTLPVTPLSLRQRWRAAPGVRPLLDGPELRLPGAEEGLLPGGRRRLGDLFRLGSGLPSPWPRPDRAAEARGILADAAVELRSGARAGRQVSLRELVSRVAFDLLRGRQPLVVDTAALREAGVDGRTRLPIRPLGPEDAALPWEERGLVVLTSGQAALLTTRRQEDLWRPGSGEPATLSAPLRQALAEAVSRGQDATGRFRSVLDWLAPEGDRGPADAAVAPLLAPWPALAPWEEWAPRAGAAAEGVPLARRNLVTAAGLAVMTVLCLMLWGGRRASAGRRRAFLMLWLAAAGLGVLWLPTALQDLAWWPLLAGCAVALAWYLRAVSRAPAAPAPRSRAAAAGAGVTAALALLAVAGSGAPPAAPAPATVYLLPGPAGKQSVLAPPALLDRLAELAAPPAAVGGVVLVGANYDGKVAGGAADFGAVFTAHSLTDGPATLALPLGGVRLYGEVLLDGARAYPEALPRPRAGYRLTVRGRGPHKIELRFRVPITGGAEDRDVSFSAPRLAQNRLGLWVPAGATSLQALVKHGSQQVKAGAGGRRLEVELGAVGIPLHFRWRQESRPPRPARVQYQEAYLWDLRAEASSLTALVHYRVAGGAVTALKVGLPAALEVRAAEAHRAAPPGAAAPVASVRLRDWRVTGAGAGRALELTFPGPVEGEFDVTLRLVPRAPLPAAVTLPLPEPHGERLSEEGYLAYQTVGVQASRGGLLRVRGIRAAEFAPFWPASSRPDPRTLAYAAKIGREPGRPPVLRLHLQPRAAVVDVVQDVNVRVGAAQAEVRARVKLTAPNRDLSLVEWQVDSALPLTVTAVSGPDVFRWGRSGNRLLVWLRQTTGTATLELSGWVPLAGTTAGKPPGPRLELPALRVVSARAQRTYVRLAAEPGLALEPAGRHNNLWPLPDPRAEGQASGYVTRQASYAGRWLVRPEAGGAVRVLTLAETRDRQLTFTASLDFEVPPDEPWRVEVRLRNWEGDDVRLSGAKARERRRGPGDRSWVLDLPPAAPGRYRVTLAGGMPAEAATGGVPMPEVTVTGVARADYRLAVAGGGLKAERAAGLTRLAGEGLGPWPGEAERVRRTAGSVWRVAAPGWRLQLMPQGRAAAAAPVRVFLTEQTAAVADGRRWLHEAVCWLRHETHADLYVTFPKRAEVLAVSVDGREMTPLQPEPSRLWLPLPGGAGVCRVRLRWRYDPEGETLDRPNLARPLLEGAVDGPAVWTVYVPAGWSVGEAPSGGSLGAGAARTATLALYRAEAQLGVSGALSEQGATAADARLAAAQRRFYAECRHAGLALEAGVAGGVAGPSGQGLDEWLRQLRARNAASAKRNGYEPARREAEAQAERDAPLAAEAPAPADDAAARFAGLGRGRTASAGAAVPPWGLPASWQAAPGTRTPQLHLVPEEERRIGPALAASGQWLGLLGAVWAISLSPYLTARLRRLWPEAFLLLGAVGWQLAGPTLVVLFLLLVAVCGRVLLLGRLLGGLWPRPATAAGSSHGTRP